MSKKRLDQLVAERFPDVSRSLAQRLIMAGKVSVEGTVVTKSGTAISDDANIALNEDEPRFVSRGGYKLEKALSHFGIPVSGRIVLDSGVSTGGFTHCLLDHGASKIYAVDVGYGIVHEKIRGDPRVVVLERTNLRNIDNTIIPELVDLVTLDLSFISVLKVIPAVKRIMKPGGDLIVLIKPQFEAQHCEISRRGVVHSQKVRKRVVDSVLSGIRAAGFEIRGVIESPLIGPAGNVEYLAYFVFSTVNLDVNLGVPNSTETTS